MSDAEEAEKKRGGFVTMDRERLRELASQGGRSAHRPGTNARGKPKKRAHEWTAAEAREAGRLGGLARAKQLREKREAEEREKSDA